jgi:hypothetical protein
MSGEDNGEQLHVSVADFATVEDVARRIKESGGTLSLAAALDPRDDAMWVAFPVLYCVTSALTCLSTNFPGKGTTGTTLNSYQ